MTLEHLKYFISVFENRSIYRAAPYFYISPQGISQGIKRLEGQVGIPLFSRTKDGLEPTPFGLEFYSYATKVVEAQNNLDLFLCTYKSSIATNIKIGFLSHDYGELSDVVLSYIPSFQQLFPEVTFESLYYNCYDELSSALKMGDIHVTWVLHAQEDDEFAYSNIYTYPICGVMGSQNKLAQKSALKWDDLKGIPMIVDKRDSQFSNVICKQCEVFGFVPNIKYYSVNGKFLMNNWENDTAISLISQPFAEAILAEASQAHFVVLPIVPALSIKTSFITCKKYIDPPLLRKFILYAKTHLKDNLWLH